MALRTAHVAVRSLGANAINSRLASRMIPAQGAVALRQSDELIGAIGVSGATAEEDEQIAKAGAESLGV